MGVKVGGTIPVSLIDYPGEIATVFFLQGCNAYCPYCHNKVFVPVVEGNDFPTKWDTVISVLDRLQNKVTGVVFTGGEPTIQPELEDALESVKKMGFKTKLDTNGLLPDRLEEILHTGFVDYVAMDVKSTVWNYRPKLTKITGSEILRSVKVITDFGVPHEFRTTCDPDFVTIGNIKEIASYIPDESSLYLQTPSTKPDIDMNGLLREAKAVHAWTSIR